MKKQKDWPLPDDDFDRLCVFCNLLYNWLPESKYKVMIRKHNNAIGAVIEDSNFTENHFDSQYGKKLPWMKGYIPDNNGTNDLVIYQEPRDQKVPSTGELRDTVITENDMIILCARNSQSLNDDDDNFTWEVSENEARQVMQMRDFDSVQKIAIGDLTEEVGKYRIMATNLRTQAETYGREVKKLQEKTNFLQQRNLDLEDINAELYRQNKLLATNKLRDEAMLNMGEINAEELGTAQGMTEMQLVKKAAKDFKDVKEQFGGVDKEDDELELMLRNEIDQTKKENAELKKMLEQKENKKETNHKEEDR